MNDGSFRRHHSGGDLAGEHSASLRLDAVIAALSQGWASSSICRPARSAGSASANRPCARRREAARRAPRIGPPASAWRPASRRARRRTRRSPRGRCQGPRACGYRTRCCRRLPPADAVCVNLIERLLVPPGAAAVGDSLVERREVFERRRLAFLGRVAQVLVEPAMGGIPCRLVHRLQPLAEPLAHQRMGVERIGRRGSGGASSRTSRSRATARCHAPSSRLTIASVSPSIAGASRNARGNRRSPAGRTGRPCA